MTENERKLLEHIRELRPYETITIQKDQNGKPDFYILKREQKIFISDSLSTVGYGLPKK